VLIGNSTLIGATGQGPISGLAYDATTDTLYGITGDEVPAELFVIDRTTGAADLLSRPFIQAGSLEIGPDGNLYAGGVGDFFGDLYQILPASGEAITVGPTGFAGITGLLLGPDPVSSSGGDSGTGNDPATAPAGPSSSRPSTR